VLDIRESEEMRLCTVMAVCRDKQKSNDFQTTQYVVVNPRGCGTEGEVREWG